MNHNELSQHLPLILSGENQRLNSMSGMGYSIPVAAKSAAGCGSPNRQRRTGALSCIAGAFFMPVIMFYGSRAREAFGPTGLLLCPRSSTPAYGCHPSCGSDVGSSPLDIGAPQMKNHAQNPSVTNRIAALKSRAISALHANSSLKVRLNRYNSAMQKARALESQGGAQ
jgi:hypothetical protein